MNIDASKTISFLFSLFAIILSITTIFMTRKNLKKQLRLNKLEEILELVYFLNGYYHRLFMLFIDTEKLKNLTSKGEDIPEYLKELPNYRQGFIETIDKETVINKISRLNILSNAYLPNSKNLKNRIHSISNIYYNMYIYVFTSGETPRKEVNAIIPKRGQAERFIKKIEEDLIKEMNLGYKSNDKKSQENYFNTQFLKDLESK